MTDTEIQTRITPRRIVLGLVGILAVLAVTGAIWMTFAPVSFWAMLTPENTGKELSVTQAYDQAISGDIVLIDIRRPDEWRKTGIGEGAQPLDMRRDDFVEALTTLIGGDLSTPVALICARGVRSAGMTKRLTEAGFTGIIDVPEGMLGSRAGPGWLASELPIREYAVASE
jgi:rhodanese-related sulfurtransferase